MARRKINPKESKVLILGMTFKENCPDIRNTQVYKIVKSLKKFSQKVDVYDPVANKIDVFKPRGFYLGKINLLKTCIFT